MKSFDNLSFEEFRNLARDSSLSKYERIGFPDSYRKGFEEIIFFDIRSKLSEIEIPQKKILDIGPGCSELPTKIIDLCQNKNHKLTLIDSNEMLELLPEKPFIEKIPALFPECPEYVERETGNVDIIICYSVLHYIFSDVSFFRFLDISLSLLAPGGQMLIGDIPNISKRKRFFSSETGIKFHQEFMKTKDAPEVTFNNIEHGQIDDSVIFAILQRARASGFDAYVVPQNNDLPMSNRREDILICRP